MRVKLSSAMWILKHESLDYRHDERISVIALDKASGVAQTPTALGRQYRFGFIEPRA
ncbi:conserved hypothetical protein [Vibrio crassostreae]|nr:conserved hypothetical protein [Vibrio crassostreae]